MLQYYIKSSKVLVSTHTQTHTNTHTNMQRTIKNNKQRHTPYNKNHAQYNQSQQIPNQAQYYNKAQNNHYKQRNSQQRLGPSNSIVAIIQKSNSYVFFKDVLEQIPGNKRVVYESLKRFGIFNMYSDDDNKEYKQYIDNMQNLWDHEGFVYIECPNQKYFVYHVSKAMYTKVDEQAARQMIDRDFFFKH